MNWASWNKPRWITTNPFPSRTFNPTISGNKLDAFIYSASASPCAMWTGQPTEEFMIFDFRFSISKKTSRSAPTNRQSSIVNRQSQGVALVVTLIMLAVITFMATTFLVLSRRERNSVSTNTDQTTARFMTDSGLERAKAQLMAAIIAETNDQNFDLMVPTNFFNPFGFDPAAGDYRTNVNYNYDKSGNPLNAAQQQQNIANLLYDPRPPVYITNQKVTNDFRYYLDLNRNGRFDDTGSISNVYYNAAGVLTTNGNISAIGDPQWI